LHRISSPPTPIVIEEHFATDAPPPPAFATAAALEVVATTTTTTATGQLSPTAAKSIMTTLAPRKKTSKSAKIIVGKLQTARNNPIPNNEHPHFSLETVEKVEGVVRPPKQYALSDPYPLLLSPRLTLLVDAVLPGLIFYTRYTTRMASWPELN
jgi:hypothetical protein